MRRPEAIDIASGPGPLDAQLGEVPDRAAVFLVHAREGAPYLGRTSLLRRRLRRLLKEREHSRWLNLRSVAVRIEYWPSGSWLESSLLYYELARRYFPETYLDMLKLRMPPYVKVILSNPFPRTQVTTRIGGGKAFYYGPFRTRAAAELFESEMLDLFQMRRCQEDLSPSPEHPGCIYGEMNMCLRPCQQVVSPEEYQAEVGRVVGFLSSGGGSLLEIVSTARDRLSEEMNFEEAARQHKRFEKIQQIVRLRDDLAQDVDRLCGVAVTASAQPDSAELRFFVQGAWQPALPISFEVVDGKPVSLDHKVRDAVAGIEFYRPSAIEKQEHLALLARWFYSSWRDGDWIPLESIDRIPYRKLVRSVSHVAVRTMKPSGMPAPSVN